MTFPRPIAALFVDEKGPYVGLDGVDVWGISRDARTYPGPHPVVAHPPCSRWSQIARVAQARWGTKMGEDEGCFDAALASVRRWGGVLEHPAESAAWASFDLTPPNPAGGWTAADFAGGWTCRVDQSHFGHKARKATWLYACGVLWLPSLPWDRKDGEFVIAIMPGETRRKRIPKSECHITPPAFRDLLIQIARSAKPL